MRTARPRPQLLFNEQEQSIFDSYVAAYRKDYSGLTPTDLIQLDDAAIYHILAVRLAGSDIAQDRQTWNTRYHPKAMERAILDDLSMTRKQRIATKQVTGDSEAEFRDLLLEIGRH